MFDTNELNDKLVSELREIAKNLGIAEADELRKAALITRIIEQEQLIGADIFGAKLFGRFIEVFCEIGNAADVGPDCRGGVVANAEILQHSLS